MTEDRSGRYNNPVGATLTGISDLFKRRSRVGKLVEGIRLDGKTVMITGASSGLGFATAVQVARLGARVLMVCRSGIPAKGEEVKRLSGSGNVVMFHADLSDLDSVRDLCEEIRDIGEKIDILISNAAMVPAKARRTPQGLEEMFVVNYLSKFYYINTLLAQNQFNTSGDAIPRIIIVSSESHRNPEGFEWDRFGEFGDYPMRDVVNRYGYFKLLLTTFASELSRRLNPGHQNNIVVRSLCPGPVNSNIAREAPAWAKPVLKVVFGLFFKSPSKAAEPVIYHAARKDGDDIPFDYLFLMSRVDIDPKASDPANGLRLWQMSEQLLCDLGFPVSDKTDVPQK